MQKLLLLLLFSATTICSEINLPNVAGIERRDLPSWVTSGPALPSETKSRLTFCYNTDTDPYDCNKSSPEFQECRRKYDDDDDGTLQRLYCWCAGKYNEYKHRCNYCMGKEGVERSVVIDENYCEGYKTSLISKGLLVASTPGPDKTPTKTTATATATDDNGSQTSQTPSTVFVEASNKPKVSGNWFEDPETATPNPTSTGPQTTITVTSTPNENDSTTARPFSLLVALVCAAFAVAFV